MCMKLTVLKEKTASTILLELFKNVYSRAATGKLELSSSPGINGLQPVMSVARGISWSSRETVAKGNFAAKLADSNLGSP